MIDFCKLTWKLAPAWFPLQKAFGIIIIIIIIIIEEVCDARFVQRHNLYICFDRSTDCCTQLLRLIYVVLHGDHRTRGGLKNCCASR